MLAPDLEQFPLVRRHVLYSPGDEITHVYFPERGVISLVTIMQSGQGVEAATVGREGMAGVPVLLGQNVSRTQWIVQIADGSHRVTRRAFTEHLNTLPHLRRLVGEYANVLFDDIAQTSACNALHPLQERCARWLLMSHDRMGESSFHLTQEFLAQMLGVYRPSVTIAAGTLQNAGLIRYRRGNIEILDREGLEDAACECYEVLRRRGPDPFAATLEH